MKVTWKDFWQAYQMQQTINSHCVQMHNLTAARNEDAAALRWDYSHSRLVYPGDVEAEVRDGLKKTDADICMLHEVIATQERALDVQYPSFLVKFVQPPRLLNPMQEIIVSYLANSEKLNYFTPRLFAKMVSMLDNIRGLLLKKYATKTEDRGWVYNLPDYVPELGRIAEEIRLESLLT